MWTETGSIRAVRRGEAMSFSSQVKEELSKECNNPRHCCIAETAAIISMCGKVIFDEKDRVRIEIHTENVTVARKYFTLL